MGSSGPNSIIFKYEFNSKNYEKIKKYFGDDKTTSLEEGLSIMSNWAKDKGVRATPVFKNIEIINNLPESWL